MHINKRRGGDKEGAREEGRRREREAERQGKRAQRGMLIARKKEAE